MPRRDYRQVQLNAGDHPLPRYAGRTVFHTDSKGKWWSGFHLCDMTAKQLLALCRSTERDLLRQFPGLRRRQQEYSPDLPVHAQQPRKLRRHPRRRPRIETGEKSNKPRRVTR
jgi:hypothetical protein